MKDERRGPDDSVTSSKTAISPIKLVGKKAMHVVDAQSLDEAASKLSAEHAEPSVEIIDQVLFIINNLTAINLEQKSPELLGLIDVYMPWFAQYLVIKRVATEANFIDLYVQLLAIANNARLYTIMT